MQYVNHGKTPGGMTIFFSDANPVGLMSTDENYARVNDAIRSFKHGNGTLEDIERALSPNLAVETDTQGEFSYDDNGDMRLVGDDEIIPNVLAERLKQLLDAGLDYTPLKAFWERLKLNPLQHSREQLYRWLEQNNVPITMDGYFIAYKSVSSSWEPSHSGMWIQDENGKWTYDSNRSYKYVIGATYEMPRDKVEHDPKVGCAAGFHVADWSYANGFSSIMLKCKIDPEAVVSVPTECNAKKMRLYKFMILDTVENEITHTPLVDEDGSDEDIEIKAPSSKEVVNEDEMDRTADKSGRVTIPRSWCVDYLEAKAGDKVYINETSTGTFVVSKAMVSDGMVATVDGRDGNVRVNVSAPNGEVQLICKDEFDGEVTIKVKDVTEPDED